MTCPKQERVTEAYISGEIESPEWSRHLEQCPECAAQLRTENDFDLIIKHAINEERLQTRQLEAHVRSAIQNDAPWRRPMFALRYGIAAVFLFGTLALATIGFAKSRIDHTALCNDAAGDHRDEIISKQPRKWRTDPKAVQALSLKIVGDSQVAERITPAGYHLVGARVCILHDKKYMHLDYSDGANEISLFVARDGSEKFTNRLLKWFHSDTTPPERVEGLTVGSVEKHHLSLVLVSSSPLSDMQKVLEDAANEL